MRKVTAAADAEDRALSAGGAGFGKHGSGIAMEVFKTVPTNVHGGDYLILSTRMQNVDELIRSIALQDQSIRKITTEGVDLRWATKKPDNELLKNANPELRILV
jgi:hypothetical protein